MIVVYKLKEYRIEKGLTIRGLALKSGVSKSEISDIEREVIHPTVYTLCLLALALDIDVRQLFDYKVSDILDKY